MRMAGWTAGSALSRTISPSLCGSTGLASTIMLSASGARRLDASSKYCAVSMFRHVPQVVVVPTGNESDLRVVTVVVAEAGRKPGTRLVQRRGHQAAPGRRPLGEPPLRFLLQSLKLGRHLPSSSGIGGQRAGGVAKRRRSHRERRLQLIDTPTPGAGKNSGTWM